MLSVVLFSVRGGIETYTAQLVNELAPIVRVAYAIDIKTKQQIGRLIDPRVTLIEYRRPRLREFWGIVEICRLAVKIKQFNPDLFHIQGDGVWESVLLRLLSNIPIVATVHDPIKHIDQRTHVNNWTMKDVVKRSRGWVLHSEGLKNIFIKLNKVNKDNVLIHPHGIYNFYCNYSPPSKNKEKFFLFFGELRINKGLDLFLEAFEMVTGQIPEWKVVIAGRGHFEQDKHLEFNRERIEFYNRYITNAEAASFFSKAGVVVLPYRHGSQSGVLAMAAAFFCPVLATRVGNIPEILLDRQHALLVEPENVKQLAKGLLEIVADESLRTTLGENLGMLANDEWSWKEIAQKTLLFYQKNI